MRLHGATGGKWPTRWWAWEPYPLRKPIDTVVTGGIPHKPPLIFRGELRQRLAGKRTVGYLALVAGEPGLANFVLELAIGINRRQIMSSPGARIESGKHQ